MENKEGLLISLMDSVSVLRNGFKHHADAIVQNQDRIKGRRFIPIEHIIEYNCVPFFKELFNEVTDSDISLRLTKILINDGMDHDDAVNLVMIVMRVTIITMSVFTDIDFKGDGYRYCFYGSCDLLILPPYREMIIDYEDQYS